MTLAQIAALVDVESRGASHDLAQHTPQGTGADLLALAAMKAG